MWSFRCLIFSDVLASHYYSWIISIYISTNSPSVLWCCWFGGRNGIRPVKKLEWWMLVLLSVCSKVQTFISPSWCQCHSLSLASGKSRLVLPFWYRLTQIVPDKGLLNGYVCTLALIVPCSWQFYCCFVICSTVRQFLWQLFGGERWRMWCWGWPHRQLLQRAVQVEGWCTLQVNKFVINKENSAVEFSSVQLLEFPIEQCAHKDSSRS